MSVDPLKKWGPSLLQGNRFYIYQGKMNPIPAGWRDVNRFLKEMKHLEKMQWAFSLPHEREVFFKQKLEVITKNLPPDWTMIVGDSICIVILLCAVKDWTLFLKSKM